MRVTINLYTSDSTNTGFRSNGIQFVLNLLHV